MASGLFHPASLTPIIVLALFWIVIVALGVLLGRFLWTSLRR
ncbi:MAG TPA: hypothetical protein VFI42_07880 [Thermomicrobiaceae bacterium]|nr:hypothetical protein [Thermomicrobiaceae bacterium]